MFLIDFSASMFAFYIVGLSAGWASALGFSTSFVVGFTLNKKVVFKHENNSRLNLRQQITLYFSLAIFNLLISAFAVEYMVDQGLVIEISKTIVVIIIAIWNYIILNRIIFRPID